MSLARVQISTDHHETLSTHLVTYKPPYRNMHLRETRQRNGRRELRYLHALYAPVDEPRTIEGMICGPDVFWHYKIIDNGRAPQLTVISERAPEKELERISSRFMPELLKRVKQEQAGLDDIRPQFLAGQFYLRRSRSGMAATHPNCNAALGAAVLNRQFVSKLAPWGFVLLRP